MTAETIELPFPDLPPAADPETYAVVEIMGHRKHIGRVREVTRFGATFTEVTTFPLPEIPAWSRSTSRDHWRGPIQGIETFHGAGAVPSETMLYSAAAIFGVRFVERALAFRLAESERYVPSVIFTPNVPQLESAGDGEGDEGTSVCDVFTDTLRYAAHGSKHDGEDDDLEDERRLESLAVRVSEERREMSALFGAALQEAIDTGRARFKHSDGSVRLGPGPDDPLAPEDLDASLDEPLAPRTCDPDQGEGCTSCE